MTTPAHLIATHLAALPHPDGTPRQLPGFATQLMPEAMAQQVTKAGEEIGEAIVHLLTTNGYTLTEQGATPAPVVQEPAQIASVYCSHCNERVMQLNITNPNRVLTRHHFTIEKCPNS